MMKKMIVMLAFCVLTVGAAQAQRIAGYFKSMPADMTPALADVNKADLVDFLNSNMRAVVKNKFDDTVEMRKMTDTYISLQTSKVGNMQLKLLRAADGSDVVCVVTTMCPSFCTSRMDFYDGKWEAVDSGSLFAMPPLTAFLSDTTEHFLADSVAHSSLADISIFKINLSPDEDMAEIRCDIEKYATKEENEHFARWLKKSPVRMKWNGTRFAVTE